MRAKIIIIILLLFSIIIIAIFSFGVKEFALRGIIEDVSEYNCADNGVCTSCMIEGNLCNCDSHKCMCGNLTVDKKECEL